MAPLETARTQCDQIGLILKGIAYKHYNKNLGLFEKVTFLVKTAVASLWATFRKYWAIFIPASGHIERGTRKRLGLRWNMKLFLARPLFRHQPKASAFGLKSSRRR